MKLLNYTSTYFSIILLIIIPVWAGLFYFAMLDEIYDSMDDGLGNQKLLVIRKAAVDPGVLNKKDFDEGNYAINLVSFEQAKDHKDVYLDTMMYMQNEKDFEPVRMLKTIFAYQNQYYRMRVITSMVEEDDLVYELLAALLWLYFGLVITIILLNNLLLQRIWRPFNRLIDQLGRFKLEEAKPVTLSETKIDEFNTLNTAVNQMLKTSMETYTSQKHFIENASHELQTPLAMTINKLEILAETESLSSHQANLLSSALDNLDRLKRLNQSLLLLSKIDNKQFPDVEPVNINDLTRRIIENFSDQITHTQVQMIFDENDECIWHMNPDLADILISNLFKNALSHNNPGGNISITINQQALIIRNTGKNQRLDERYIFNRFYKEGDMASSTGLGLALVKAVADQYGLRVSYRFDSAHIFQIER